MAHAKRVHSHAKGAARKDNGVAWGQGATHQPCVGSRADNGRGGIVDAIDSLDLADHIVEA